MTHDVRVVTLRAGVPGRTLGTYRAECRTCGYRSRITNNGQRAREDAIAHKHIAKNYTPNPKPSGSMGGMFQRGQGY